jgi:serine/threonine-protein kinase
VLRVDAATQSIWIAAPLGRALADEPRGLSPGQIARLREAVEALHAVGGAHGRIEADHLYAKDGDVTLAFPRGEPVPDAAARDREALARLDGHAAAEE